ncbi:hypothetical protein D3C84_1255970 [compost metagenome]
MTVILAEFEKSSWATDTCVVDHNIDNAKLGFGSIKCLFNAFTLSHVKRYH